MPGPNDYIPDWTEQDGPYEDDDVESDPPDRYNEDEDIDRDR